MPERVLSSVGACRRVGLAGAFTVRAAAGHPLVKARDFGLPRADGGNDVNEVVRTLEVANPLIWGRRR